ncbi:MAG TPA: hypothetical protein VG448_10275 [Solirubrobacterales bacterium]|nr:hypothetical protein [Solirubrobacterales bacterium]
MRPTAFTGPLLEDLATLGGAALALGAAIGHTYARIYNWANKPTVNPLDPVYEAENAAGLLVSLVIPVVLMGHAIISLGVL